MKPLSGLTQADAAARLQAEGHNELPQSDRRTPFRIAIEVLREPMLALLLVGGIVYLALGDLKEAIILVAFATMSIVITVVQETRTERVLEALRDLTSPRALVIRDGERRRSPAGTSCGATFIVLSEGDRVPADAVLLRCQDLQADESTLTGESCRCARSPGTIAPGLDRSTRVATTCRISSPVRWWCAARGWRK
jgi:Ca2+-transporting ATPase